MSSFVGNGNIGRSNIEFEAKFTSDLMSKIVTPPPTACCIAFQNSANFELYDEWLFAITNFGSYLPKDFSAIKDKYYGFIEKFVVEKPVYNFPIDYNLQPQALFELLKDCL
jgi:hypothetical protein